MFASNTRRPIPTKIAWDLGDTLIKIKDSKLQEGAARVSMFLRHYITKYQLECAIKDEWAHRKDPCSLDKIRNINSSEAEINYWESDFYPCALRRLGMSNSNKTICSWFADLQVSPKSFELMPYAKKTLESLRVAGIEQALLSNAFPSARRAVKYHKLENYFKIIIFSFDYKLVKPDAKIYELLEEKFNLTFKDKIIFVDDRKEFLAIPPYLNIIPVWLNNHSHQTNDWNGEEISNLEKVLDYYFESVISPKQPASLQSSLF